MSTWVAVPERALFAAFLLVGAAYFAVFCRPGRLLRWWGQRRRRTQRPPAAA